MRERLFIDGNWTASQSAKQIAVVDPATEEAIQQIAAGNAGDVDLAVTAASRAFVQWRRRSGTERAGFLRAIAARITARREELARMEVLDNGKPLPEALWDIDDAAGCFAYYADLAESFDARRESEIALPDTRFVSKSRLEPVGVAALIIPWNYPLLMAAWKVAPALAAGATMVLKPSEFTSLTALELAAIAEEADLPPGVLNVVTGLGADVGDALSRHPLVRKVAFTGSVPTGVKVMANSAQEIKSISLELGGKSPIIVFDDADIDKAVEWIMFGVYWNQGQVCSATSRLLVQEAIAPRLIEKLVAESGKIAIGHGLEPGTLLGPLVSEVQRAKVEFAVKAARAAGIRIACGGGRPKDKPRGYFFEPTLLLDPPVDSAAWTEEIFGPVLAVRRFRAEAEALALANDTRFGLAAAVMSADQDRCERVAREFDAGIVWINCSQPTFTQAPWGGMKQSGIGRELGEWGFMNYLETKQITTYATDAPWGWYLK